MRSPYSIFAACLSVFATHAAALGDGKKDRPLKELMGWYHTSDEIHDELSDLVGSCHESGNEAEMFVSGGLDVVRVKALGAESGTKAVLVFGEHARELISPESALGLIRSLCSSEGPQSEFAKRTLARGVEFVVVPNANPSGRRVVEAGYYCKRTNENGVDLNRNWGDEHRNGASPGDDANPGPQGFSEPETRALRDLVDQERPDMFLSVHSGAYLLGASPGYQASSPEDEKIAADVLGPISDKYCGGSCPYGGLRDLIGYDAAGCDIDYIHENSGVRYAFTWEIYNGLQGMDSLVQRQTQRSRREGGRLLRGSKQASLSANQPGGSPLPEDEQDPQSCIQQFLPRTESQTKEVVGKWTGAFLDFASIVMDRKLVACRAAMASGSPDEQQPGTRDCLTLETADSSGANAAASNYANPKSVAASATSPAAATPSEEAGVAASPSSDTATLEASDSISDSEEAAHVPPLPQKAPVALTPANVSLGVSGAELHAANASMPDADGPSYEHLELERLSMLKFD